MVRYGAKHAAIHAIYAIHVIHAIHSHTRPYTASNRCRKKHCLIRADEEKRSHHNSGLTNPYEPYEHGCLMLMSRHLIHHRIGHVIGDRTEVPNNSSRTFLPSVQKQSAILGGNNG